MAKALKIAGTVAGIAAIGVLTAGAGVALLGGATLAAGLSTVAGTIGVSFTTLALVSAGPSEGARLVAGPHR